MGAETQQEVELSKQAIHFSKEIGRLRASNEELCAIISKYQAMVEKMSAPQRPSRFKQLFGRLYWYKKAP